PAPVTAGPSGAYTSGDHSATATTSLSDNSLVLSGSATATFVAANCIELKPGFHVTAGSAATTFHAFVGTAPSIVSATPTSGSTMTATSTWPVPSPAGNAALEHVFALFKSTSTDTTNACYIHYDPVANLLYLANNNSDN